MQPIAESGNPGPLHGPPGHCAQERRAVSQLYEATFTSFDSGLRMNRSTPYFAAKI